MQNDKYISTFTFEVEPFTEDFTGHLSWSGLGNILLRSAQKHASARGFGFGATSPEGLSWVFSRLIVECPVRPAAGQRFHVSTWPIEVRRQFTIRLFRIFDNAGNTIGHAYSVWALIDLKTRAQIESLYWSITREVNSMVHTQKHVPDELRSLDRLLADKYFCNFSLFQSLPDSWAIDQLFPVMPIQRLDERPERNVTLQDITCDSDGKITQYVNSMQQTAYIPMHTIHRGERYYVGVFLVGAYQEILGNMHNLFGDTNAVHVTVTDNGYSIDRVIEGETVAEVLDYVQYDPKRLQRRLETWVKRAELAGKISISEGNEFLANYRSGLYGYTYLELNDEDLYRENDRVRYKDKKSEKQEDKDDEK